MLKEPPAVGVGPSQTNADPSLEPGPCGTHSHTHAQVCTHRHTLQEGPHGTHQPSHSGPPCRAVCRLAKRTPATRLACGARSGSSAQGVPTCAWRSSACCGLARDHHVTSPRFTFPSWVSDRRWESLSLPRARLGSTNRGGVECHLQTGELGAQPSSRLSVTAGPPAQPCPAPCPPWLPRLPCTAALLMPSPPLLPHLPSAWGLLPRDCPCPHGRLQTLRAW